MLYSLPEVPTGITSYFDDEHPLGPVAADQINDEEVAAYLVTLEIEAARDLTHGASILFGRKGAGKSSILKSFTYGGEPRSHRVLSLSDPNSKNVLKERIHFLSDFKVVLNIDSADLMEIIYERMEHKPLKSPEGAAKEWKRDLWLAVLKNVLKKPALQLMLNPGLQMQVSTVVDTIASLGIDPRGSSYFDKWLNSKDAQAINVDLLIERLHADFLDKDIVGLLLIDSMEEYDLEYDEIMKKVIGGLLQLVATEKNSLQYKIAFPEEIYEQVRNEANPEKYTIRSTRILWRPIELLRILTDRMLICFYVHENAHIESFLSLKNKALKERDRILNFWSEIFDGPVVNEAGHQEAGIYFILRHTQMLPRQVINSMSELLKGSKPTTRSYMKISRPALVHAVRRACDQLIGGIESGFKFTYRDVRDVFDAFLPKCPILCSYDDLEREFQRAGLRRKAYDWTSEFPIFLRALLHMGVIGVVQNETSRYIETSFGYTDDTVLRSAQGNSYALHPAFSLLYKDEDSRLDLKRAVLPRGSLEDLPI